MEKLVESMTGACSEEQHTLQEELVAITGEELGAFCSDGGNGVRDAGQKAQQEEEQHLQWLDDRRSCLHAHGGLTNL